MKFLSTICYILAFFAGLFLVLLPAIFTWAALFNNMIGGILFSIFLLPIAVLGYPIVILVAGLATGIGGTASTVAAVLGYVMIGVVVGIFCLGGWLFEKADDRKYKQL